MKIYSIFLLVVMLLFAACQPTGNTAEIKIIPKPVSLIQTGKSLVIDQGVRIETSGPDLSFACRLSESTMQKLTPAIWLVPGESGVKVELKFDQAIPEEEGYKLTIGDKIVLAGKTKNGVIHGIQSLLQILEQGKLTDDGLVIPTVDIVDYPRFAYRGMHLDVSRHFFGVDLWKSTST